MKVSELRKNLHVGEISVANKRREELWILMSVEARELEWKSETSKETRWVFLRSW